MRRGTLLLTLIFLSCADEPPDDDDDTIGGDGDADADADAGADGCAPVLAYDGSYTGIEGCEADDGEGRRDYHRLEPAECLTTVEEGGICGDARACPLEEGGIEDCGERGLCLWNWTGCRCHETCATDDDCGDGFACVCAGRTPLPEEGSYISFVYASLCVEATCRTDADCPGERCVIAEDGCASPVALACRGDADTCSTHADCEEGRCGRDSGSWECADWWSCE